MKVLSLHIISYFTQKNKIDCRGAVYFVQKGYFGFEIMRLSGGITTVLLYKIFERNASVSVKKK